MKSNRLKKLPITSKALASALDGMKSGKSIAAAIKRETKIANGRIQDQGASLAQDPVAALFNGVKLRNSSDRFRLEQSVRDYCYQQIGSNWKAQERQNQEQISSLQVHIRVLEEALRASKRNSANEVIEATRGRIGERVHGVALADERGGR